MNAIRVHGKRGFAALSFALLLTACGSDKKPVEMMPQAEAPTTTIDAGALEEQARAIHERVLTIDTHVDIPTTYMTRAADPGIDGPMQVDLPKMIKGGLDVAFFVVYVPQGPLDDAGYAAAHDAALLKFDAIARQSALYGHIIERANSPADVERIVAENKRAALIGVENAYPLGPSTEAVRDFYERGARYISITHAGDNQFGSSSTPRGELNREGASDSGLTNLGRAAVAEMNRLGIMVDVSHASRRTTLDTVKASRAPVIASHSGVKGVADIPRNLSDRELKAIAKRGGVVQIVAFDVYLKIPSPERVAAITAIRQEIGLTSPEEFRSASQEKMADFRNRVAALDDRFERASVKDLADHIDYAAKLIGIDHVGIASDFGGGGGIRGWADASESTNVTLELVQRGYSEADIAKLWSGNLLRVWRDVERVAAGLQGNS